jgi:hypothetical protein
MQSAIGSALTISAITKASPGVATVTAHGLANGDYVVLDVQGMIQLNGKVVRVASVATNTFQLEGVDTTLFDTFSTGTAKKLTFGTTVSTFTSINSSGGDYEFLDITTIHDKTKTQIPGVASAQTYTFDSIWDPNDAALAALKLASDTQAQRAMLFTFGSGSKMVFNGYVGASLTPGGSAQDKVTTSVSITAFGTPTYYTS